MNNLRKKPFDPILTLPRSIKQRWQKSQNTIGGDLNSYKVTKQRNIGSNTQFATEFEDGSIIIGDKPWLPGADSKSGIGKKVYKSQDYPSDSSYL